MDLQFLLRTFNGFSPNESIRQKALSEISPKRSVNYPAEIMRKARKAGVLLHFYEAEGALYFTLIERPSYKGVHSGQIALPGGKAEKFDKDIIATALREAKEEVNIEPDSVVVITALSPIYIPPSNFLVTPVLSYSESIPNFDPDPKEVKSIIHVRLNELLEKDLISSTQVTLDGGFKLQTNYLAIQNKVVWGATAILLNEFRHYLQQEV